MLITFIRHGETKENASGVIQGWSPTDLSDNGFHQAHLCGEWMKIHFRFVICILSSGFFFNVTYSFHNPKKQVVFFLWFQDSKISILGWKNGRDRKSKILLCRYEVHCLSWIKLYPFYIVNDSIKLKCLTYVILFSVDNFPLPTFGQNPKFWFVHSPPPKKLAGRRRQAEH